MDKNEVNEAFEILLEEIELISNEIKDQGALNLKSGEYDKAQMATEQAKKIEEFREKVKALQKEWKLIFKGKIRRKPKKGFSGKLKRGLRTPEDSFRKPILESLVELGGSAKMSDVLNLVEKKLKGRLTKYDYESLPSDTKTIRWKNTAQWCRNSLVKEGLMKSGSPWGIWEITEKGRKFLKGI
ncbi:MAG: winged helix-turn-helix domain-containing protein [Candidatus Aminicenantes bacterium]|nr:winged helix-turn-helix domain-containing protein [Candidatus Aminicenantes bacterium]